MSHNKHALQLYLVLELFKQRQQNVIHNQKAVLRVVHNECQLLRMQSKIECVHHAACAWDAKVSFQMRRMVPAKRRYAIARLQPRMVQRFRQRLRPPIEIQIAITLQATIGTAGNNFNRRVSFGNSLQDSLQGERVIHHGSLHCKTSSGAFKIGLDTK